MTEATAQIKAHPKRAANTSRPKPSRWGEQRRLEFIEFRLLWNGRINRSELVEFFEISIQQASLDLAEYAALAPGNLYYDRQSKVYRAAKSLNPVFIQADSQILLNQLRALKSGSLPSSMSFIGWQPPFEIVQLPLRAIDSDILIRVLWAIRDREELEVQYQSMREPVATRRWIAPHALAFDGARWHLRAWCHAGTEFRDFVLGRIQRIQDSRTTSVDSNEDLKWHRMARVILRARSTLTKQQRNAIEHEFGMRGGELQVSMREALVFYFVRQLNLIHARELRAVEQPLEWVNEADFEELLTAARK